MSNPFFQHYGVKGMKWGVRRTDAQLAKASPKEPEKIALKQAPGKKVQAEGGRYRKADDDAVRVAVLKQRAAKSTTDSLSTKELQDLVQRMNLEQQYAKLAPDTRSAGKVFLDNFLDAEVKAAKSGNAGPTQKTMDLIGKVLDK